MAFNQIIIIVNGDDNRVYKRKSNKLIIGKKENKLIEEDYTLLQTDFKSVDDFVKANQIIKKQASPIDEFIIINKNINLNMISYQHDYSFISDNYLILTNLFFFINLLIPNFNKKLNFILSFENKNHYKIHTNIFNQSIINYLKTFKKDLKESYSIIIKKLN